MPIKNYEIIKSLILKAKECNNIEALNFLLDDKNYESLEKMIDISKDLNDEITLEYKSEHSLYSKIAHALSSDYFSVYYVNIITDEYIEYSSNFEYQELEIEHRGVNFFDELIENAPRVVYKDDLNKVLDKLKKEVVIKEINRKKIYTLEYRLMINNNPHYVMLRIIKIKDDENHIVIGVSSINELKKREENYVKLINEVLSSTSMSLASDDYLTIYNVDIRNGEYTEYSPSQEYQALELRNSGNNFFDDVQAESLRVIHKDDALRVRQALEKNEFIKAVKAGTFVINYRLMMDYEPIYVSLKAMMLPSDTNHIIIGVSNINEQTKMLEREKELARKDALTGAFNKFAYIEKEKEINELINNKKNYNFSLAVCDINDLKKINDTFGHSVGDDYIKDAYLLLKDIYKNSLIYRIGGDEFIIIIEGSDYLNGDELYNKFINKINDNKKNNLVTLAIGYDDYNELYDKTLNDIFSRADMKMYDNKRIFKNN